MKVDSKTHFEIRWWCIKNIPMINSYRQWSFYYPKNQKYKTPYEFYPYFENDEDAVAFKLRWT